MRQGHERIYKCRQVITNADGRYCRGRAAVGGAHRRKVRRIQGTYATAQMPAADAAASNFHRQARDVGEGGHATRQHGENRSLSRIRVIAYAIREIVTGSSTSAITARVYCCNSVIRARRAHLIWAVFVLRYPIYSGKVCPKFY